MARQYFNATLADSLTTVITTSFATAALPLFTPTQANQFFPLPSGANPPSAGQVFRFAMGGLMTTPTAGTLIISAYHGPGTSTTVFGTNMGASTAQNYVPSLTNTLWRLEGEIVYRTISPLSTASTAWLVGTFTSVGAIATAGSSVNILFGSTGPVSVDTSTLGGAGLFGSLNFNFTFSVTAASISVEYTSMQSLN